MCIGVFQLYMYMKISLKMRMVGVSYLYTSCSELLVRPHYMRVKCGSSEGWKEEIRARA